MISYNASNFQYQISHFSCYLYRSNDSELFTQKKSLIINCSLIIVITRIRLACIFQSTLKIKRNLLSAKTKNSGMIGMVTLCTMCLAPRILLLFTSPNAVVVPLCCPRWLPNHQPLYSMSPGKQKGLKNAMAAPCRRGLHTSFTSQQLSAVTNAENWGLKTHLQQCFQLKIQESLAQIPAVTGPVLAQQCRGQSVCTRVCSLMAESNMQINSPGDKDIGSMFSKVPRRLSVLKGLRAINWVQGFTSGCPDCFTLHSF